MTKDKQIHFRVGAEDVSRLEALAAFHEMPAAQVVRMLIKREYHAAIEPARTKR